MLVVNMVGLGAGPVLIGWMSDLLAPAYGVESLRYALLASLIAFAIGLFAFLVATRTVTLDIAEANPDPSKA
jgi:MFS family permease